MRYVLMSKNTPLMTFEFASGSLPGRIVHSVSIIPDVPTELFPAEFLDVQDLITSSNSLGTIRLSEDFLRDPDDVFSQWLHDRRIPTGRSHARELSTAINTTLNRYEDIAKITHFASMTDCCWIAPFNTIQTWNDVSLFRRRNGFDSKLSLIALHGIINHQTDKGQTSNFLSFRRTPEFSTGGMLAKTWRFDENDPVPILLKSGSLPPSTVYTSLNDGSQNYVFGLEPYSEVLTAHLAFHLGLNCIPYHLEFTERTKMPVSACNAFTNEQTEFVPMLALVRERDRLRGSFDIRRIYSEAKGIKRSSKEALLDMLLFDALILNTDRHFGNFGFLRNTNTGRIVDVAPLFDHGSSLCHSIPTETLMRPKGIEFATQSHFPAFGTSFELQLESNMLNRSDAEHVLYRLTHLLDDKDSNPFSYRSYERLLSPVFPAERLELLDQLLYHQAMRIEQLAKLAMERYIQEKETSYYNNEPMI